MKIRWIIFGYLCTFGMLAYIQRTSIGVAAQSIMPALHLTQMQIGWLNAAFAACYALTQLPGGLLGQRYGARIVFTGIGLVGIVATIATPFAPVVLTGTALFIALLAAQGLLGASQGPMFPTIATAFQAWFPARQWAIANGLNSLALTVGGAATPLLIVSLTAHYGWQRALLFVAAPAVLLTASWAWYARDRPCDHRKTTAAELAEVADNNGGESGPITIARLRRIVGQRDVALLAFSYFCMNYVFYLLSTWSFLYLVQQRNFTGLESGVAGMMPWIGAGIGAGIGGFLSDGLALRWGYRRGYRVVPLVSMPIVGVLLITAITVATPYASVAALMATFFAIELNEGAYWGATMRVARTDTGAATGVLNTGGNIAGIVSAPIVGALSGSGHWNATFVIGAVFAVIAGACWLAIDADRRVAH